MNATQPHAPAMNKVETKEFKVVVVSSNTQSFGHRGYVLLARDGKAFEGNRIDGSCRADPIDRFKQGDTITFEVDKTGRPNKPMEHGFELFEDKPFAPRPLSIRFGIRISPTIASNRRIDHVWNVPQALDPRTD